MKGLSREEIGYHSNLLMGVLGVITIGTYALIKGYDAVPLFLFGAIGCVQAWLWTPQAKRVFKEDV